MQSIFSNTEFGCMLMFPMDPELADAYYLEHHIGSNYTAYICTPRIPVRPDMRRKYVEMFPNTYSMVLCWVHELGSLKRLYQQGRFLAEVHKDQIIFLLVSVIITFTGVCGEYSWSSSGSQVDVTHTYRTATVWIDSATHSAESPGHLGSVTVTQSHFNIIIFNIHLCFR